MKNSIYSFLTILFLCTSLTSQGQTYADWGLSLTGSVYDTINFGGDTLRFQFSNCPAGAFGQAKLVIYFEGDFSDNTEYMTVYSADSSALSNGPYDSLGIAGPNSALVNCAPADSAVFSFSVDTINFYAPNLAFILIPTTAVQTFVCASNRARVRLEYNYCPFGVPVEYATITLPDSVFCSLDGAFPLSGTPSGGTFSGAGVTGNNFDPFGLTAGSYVIYYTAADSIGCISSASASVTILPTPVIADTVACPGTTVTLTGSLPGLVWYSDAGLTTVVGSGTSYTTPPVYSTTSFYAAYQCNDYYFRMDTLLADSINIVDNNAAVGDDEGGIAVTPDYIYYRATTGTIRYDSDLTNPQTLPLRDGIFSDLATGQLYSLWNTQTNNDPDANDPNGFVVNALIGMNADLSFGSEIVQLSQPVDMGTDNYFMNGIFAGAGVVGIYSGNTNHFYTINLCSGKVTDLGFNGGPAFRGSESWSDWGILEYDGTDYSIIYRDSIDDDIHRMILPAGTITSAGTFPAGLADMACITYSPWNKNWYFHFEGVSGTFGGTAETTGYANAGDSMSVIPGGTTGCAEEVTVTVNNINLGSDTSLCQQNYVLFAGLGYSSYVWNGVNSNFNSYTATGTDTVIFEGLYQDGCTHFDTVLINMNPYPIVDLGGDVSDCGGPVILDASNAGAGYLWSDGSTGQTLQVSNSGTYTVTVTNAGGCSSSDDNQVTIYALPSVALSLNPVLVCINWAPYVLTGGSPAGGTYSGTAVSNGSFIPSFAGLGTFSISYLYTDSNGCSGNASQNLTVDACAGITEPTGNGFATIFPNPGNGLIHLLIHTKGSQKINAGIFDMGGKMIHSFTHTVTPGLQIPLDVSSFSSGVYTVKITSEKEVQTLKLVIQH